MMRPKEAETVKTPDTVSKWCQVCGGMLSMTSWYEAVCMRRVEAGGCGARYALDAGGSWKRSTLFGKRQVVGQA